MKPIVRIAGYTGAGIALIVIVAAIAIPSLSDRKQTRQVGIPLPSITFASDPQALERGKYLFETRSCASCHGEDGGGGTVIGNPDDGDLYVRAPSIAPGGIASGYRDADWVRLLRHGVKPAGTPVLVMPSEDYSRLTDADVGAVATYVRSLAPMPAVAATMKLPFMAKALYVAGGIPDAAEKIDHSLPPPSAVPEGVTPEYGAYVGALCVGCHGSGLSGGRVPGTPPSWPPAANITTAPDSSMQHYPSTEQFRAMMRSGKRPDGSKISTVMPVDSFARMSDLELDALFTFLKKAPPRTTGTR